MARIVRGVSANATFCSTLVDEWASAGLDAAVIAPGSRSTPLALALIAEPRITCHVVLDERSAAFMALGLAIDGRPALVLCTSGTAAVNLHPAVVEADLSDVPLLVCTADRPPELRGVGAPQTIDQVDLFGRSVRASTDAAPPDDSDPASWRPLAAACLAAALGSDGGRPGPVHLNLPFREPLVGAPGQLPPVLESSTEARPARAEGALPDGLLSGRGLILVGGRHGCDPAEILDLAARLCWPVLADPTSGLRAHDAVVSTADAIVRSERFTDAHRPDVVVRIGRPAASKVLSTWLSSLGCPVVQVGGPGRIDPDRTVVATATLSEVLLAVGTPAELGWASAWTTADEAVLQVHSSLLSGPELDDPTTARTLARCADHLGARVVVASSMPVRDLEWFGGPTAVAHSNRGANGIDGVMSTALGVAARGHATIALVGDLAFVHDANALWGITDRGVDLRVVVVDNDGGGIFSFLPQADDPGGAIFERLFGTPHGADVVSLAGAFGVEADVVHSVADLEAALALPGPRLIRVPSDRVRNVEVHRRLHEAAAAAVDALYG